MQIMSALEEIQMFAGNDANGQPFVERLQAKVDDQGRYQLIRSPAFIKGLAKDDIIKLDASDNHFEIQQRSGNLCIRVFSKEDIRALHEDLTPEMEKLGAELDLETPRMLVYSIHVSCGFNSIEEVLNRHVGPSSTWLYGNVYDPADGCTPLNWWLDILKPQ